MKIYSSFIDSHISNEQTNTSELEKHHRDLVYSTPNTVRNFKKKSVSKKIILLTIFRINLYIHVIQIFILIIQQMIQMIQMMKMKTKNQITYVNNMLNYMVYDDILLLDQIYLYIIKSYQHLHQKFDLLINQQVLNHQF